MTTAVLTGADILDLGQKSVHVGVLLLAFDSVVEVEVERVENNLGS